MELSTTHEHIVHNIRNLRIPVIERLCDNKTIDFEKKKNLNFRAKKETRNKQTKKKVCLDFIDYI